MCGCNSGCNNNDQIIEVITDGPLPKGTDHLIDISMTPGQPPKVTKVQAVAPGTPASHCQSESEVTDDGVAVNTNKPPPQRDPKTGKPVPPKPAAEAKEQVQIPAKPKPPSKEKAL